MKIEFQVEMKPFDLTARLQRGPQMAMAVMDEMIEDVAQRVAFRAKNYAPYATGALRRSISPHRVKLAEWEVVAVGSEKRPYAAYMEFGTRPHWPPQEPIEDWVRIKLGVREASEIRRLAYLVRRAIARRGTAPRHYMRRAFEQTAKETTSIVTRYLPALARAIAGK